MKDRAFAFILGAGASKSSGIKTAGEMVQDWIADLYRKSTNPTRLPLEQWATPGNLGIPSFNPSDPAASYADLYFRMFARDPARGYAYLEHEMKDAEPSYGYSVLGRILDTTRHMVVITTNFDNLVADSLSIFSKTYPLVCGHESLAGFVRARLRRPLVMKVHRDLLFEPRNTPAELSQLSEAYRKALTELFHHYTPIVIGYGGNDGSFMGYLGGLPPRSIPGGVYWCYYAGGAPPRQEIRDFVAGQDGSLIGIPDFDELMMLLGDRLGFDVPDKFVTDRAQERARRIVEQVRSLRDRVNQVKDGAEASALPEAPLPAKGTETVAPKKPITSEPGKTHGTEQPKRELASALRQAVTKTMERQDGARRWWQWEALAQGEQDPGRKDSIYKAAIEDLPESPELLGNYAIFLTKVRKEHDAAEAMYKRALEADPKQANTLVSYAIFLKEIRKDHDAAEAMYKRALEADPKHGDNLVNYAWLLLGLGRADEGMTQLTKAIAALDPGLPKGADAECWFYGFCFWSKERQGEALAKLKDLIVRLAVRSPGWDFSAVVAQALQRGHEDASWLTPLADVISEKIPPASLDAWERWRNTEPKSS